VNPADSRFCNACGAQLNLALCPHCAAVNARAAKDCYQCGGSLTGRSADTLAARSPVAGAIGASNSGVPAAGSEKKPVAQRASESDAPDRVVDTVANELDELRELLQLMNRRVSGTAATPSAGADLRSQTGSVGPNRAVGPPADRSLTGPVPAVAAARALPAVSATVPRRRRTGAIVGTIVLGVLAVVGYYAYRQHAALDVAKARSASGETAGHMGPTSSGVVVNLGAEPVREPSTASTAGPVVGPAVANAPSVPPASEGSAATVREEDATSDEPRRGAGAVKEASPGDGTGPAKPPSAAAPPAPAVQRRGARELERPPEAAAAAAVLIPRSQKSGAGTGIEPPRPLLGPCTEALAALGLCAPELTQRRE